MNHFLEGQGFSLTLLLLLMGLTVWLLSRQQAAETPEEIEAAVVDYALTNFTAYRLNADGQLKSQIKAAEMQHYPKKNAELTMPVLMLKQTSGELVFATAERGEVSPNNEDFWLLDKAKVWRTQQQQLDLEIFSDNFHWNQPQQIAKTAAPVKILQYQPVTQKLIGTTEGIGMTIWFDSRQLELHSQVKGTYEKQ